MSSRVPWRHLQRSLNMLPRFGRPAASIQRNTEIEPPRRVPRVELDLLAKIFHRFRPIARSARLDRAAMVRDRSLQQSVERCHQRVRRHDLFGSPLPQVSLGFLQSPETAVRETELIVSGLRPTDSWPACARNTRPPPRSSSAQAPCDPDRTPFARSLSCNENAFEKSGSALLARPRSS